MNMDTNLKFEMTMPRRKAKIKISKYWQDMLKLDEEETDGYVLGIYQIAEEKGEAYPVTVVELEDGRVIMVDPTNIIFEKEVE